ncbi:MAG: mechanosensitive ion channel domain-containing protein [Nanoarchaeota archaeon]
MVLNESVKILEKTFTVLNPTINRLVIALIILFLGFIIGRILGKLLFRALREIDLDAQTKKWLKMHIPLEKFLSNLVSYLIYFFAIVLALDQLMLISFILYMVLGAVFIALIMSFLLSIKDFLPNAISGIRIKKKRLFRIGDHISLKSVGGTVEKISILDTMILTSKGDTVYIPNSRFNLKELKVRKKRKMET